MKPALAISSMNSEFRTSPSINIVVGLLSVAMAAAALWIFRTANLAEAGAFFGYSPAGLADPVRFSPEFLAKDFPGGEDELLKSLPMLLYPLVGSLGISGIALFKVMMPLEIAAVVIGSYIATRLLRPGSTPIGALLVGLCLFAGSFVNFSLARWGHPSFGTPYNFAYGLGLVGTAFLITGKARWGALLMALAFMVHPLIALLMLMFAGSAILSDFRRYQKRSLIEAAGIFTAAAGAWIVFSMRDAGVTGSEIPADLYIGLTRIMSFHWYPVTLGVFGRLLVDTIVPYTSFCLLLVVYLYDKKDRLAGLERQLAAGFLGMVLVTISGILISEYSGVPALIKLALHRASSIFLMMGIIVIIPGLWRDVAKGDLLRGTFALAALIMPFATLRGIPSLIALAVAVPALVQSVSENPRSQRSLVYLSSLVVFSVVAAWLWHKGFPGWRLFDAYTGARAIGSLEAWQIAVVVGLAAIGLLLRQPAVLLVLVGLCAVYWSPSVRSFKTEAALRLGQDYLAVQTWARTATEPGSIFMPDPGHSYGWREGSQRPSFGAVREWLQNSFMYNSRKVIFDEGLKRFAEFGLPLDEYLHMDPNLARGEIVRDVRSRYYNAPKEWFAGIHERYGVEYFVFERARLKGASPLPVAYENESYIVGRASQ
jgi:hypothetical protein